MPTAIPTNLQTAFQDAWDSAAAVSTLSAQQLSLQAQLAACNVSLATALADRDTKELVVITITRDLLGNISLPPAPP